MFIPVTACSFLCAFEFPIITGRGKHLMVQSGSSVLKIRIKSQQFIYGLGLLGNLME